MAVLTKLKLSDAKRDVVRDPVAIRRQKLIDKLGEQAKLANGLINGEAVRFTRMVNEKDAETGARKQVEKPKRVRQWFWHDLNGAWFLEVRFGKRCSTSARASKPSRSARRRSFPRSSKPWLRR